MNDSTFKKYYSFFLYKKVPDIYLVEDKILEDGSYTPNSILNERNSFTKLRLSLSNISFSSSSFDFDIPYQTYEFCNVDYVVANDSVLDGFCYDADAGRVVYGSTFVYAFLDNGVYREIVTGKEIPDVLEHTIHEVQSVSGLQRMYKHLELILAHKALYEKIFLDTIEKLAIGHQNYLLAYQEYTERMQILLRKHEESARRERAIREEALLAKNQEERNLELTKIRSMILKIKNSV